MDLRDQRLTYNKSSIDFNQINIDPFIEFKTWFNAAIESKTVKEPTAMIISSVSLELQPSSRVVLLKMITENGFVFFTNYNSRKGEEISENQKISVLFFWPELEQQIRIHGIVSKISDQDSDEYFYSRPKDSQISAIVSDQSKKIESKSILELKVKELEQSTFLKRPENWGGYEIKPHYFEFWQGRPNRLHDRVYFEFVNNEWKKGLLQP